MDFDTDKFLEQVLQTPDLLGPEDLFYSIRIETGFDTEDAIQVARLVTNPDGYREYSFFLDWCTNFLAACMLHELYYAKRLVMYSPSLPKLAEDLFKYPLQETLQLMVLFPHHEDTNTHSFVRAMMRDAMLRKKQEMDQLMQELKRCLQPYLPPAETSNMNG